MPKLASEMTKAMDTRLNFLINSEHEAYHRANSEDEYLHLRKKFKEETISDSKYLHLGLPFDTNCHY